MNLLDRYIYFYSSLYNRKGMHPYMLTPIRRIVRYFAKKQILNFFAKNKISISNRTANVVVSLTSFPARIEQVHQVIQCMLRQTVCPKKIILWLSKEQFSNVSLPDNLTALLGEVFCIRFVDGDIRSHKKYYYVLKEYPDDYILLIDDDLYYPTNMLEELLEDSQKHPDSVICRYGSMMKFTNDILLPYNSWWDEMISATSDLNIFFGTGGGTLLKKSFLYKDVLDIDLALKLTPLADDIWINAMVNLANTPKYKQRYGLIMSIDNTQEIRLSKDNVSNNQNDIQFNNIISYYINKIGKNPFKSR